MCKRTVGKMAPLRTRCLHTNIRPARQTLRSPWGATKYENPSKLEIQKKNKKYKIPHSGLGPENPKKIQTNYENGQKMTIFVFFLSFFRIFGAHCFFFVFFSYFQFEGFRILYQPVEIPNETRPVAKGLPYFALSRV